MRSVALLAGRALALILAACRGPAGAGSRPDAAAGTGIELTIDGNASFDGKELEALVREALGDNPHPSKADVDDAAFALERFYLGRGFHAVRVDYEYEAPPAAPARARLFVSEGGRARIGDLALHGNASIDDELLRGVLEGAAPGRPYVRSVVAAGVRKVRELYLERGFLRVDVSLIVEGLADPDGAVLVILEIAEGPAFRVRAIESEGGLPELEESQRRIVEEHTGLSYTPRLDYALRARTLELYSASGYPECEVEVQSTLGEDGAVDLHARVRPGPRVRVGALVVRGNERTRDELIRERITIDPGDVYDSRKIRESFRALYATGLFESVRMELEPAPRFADGSREEQERLLQVDVVEASTLDLELEVGWGSYEGPRMGLRVDEKNLFGTGFGAFVDSTLSWKAQSGRVGLIDRDLFGTAITGETSVFASRREEPSFTNTEVGAGVGAGYRWNPRWSGTVAYEIRRAQLDDVDVDITLDPEALEDTNVGTIAVGLARETRDNVLLPERGSRARAQLTWATSALGSEIDFLRGNVDLARLVPLGKGFQLVGSARTGMMAPLSVTEEIPLQERFYNGGENTVRSFREDELGPKDVSGTPLGGEASTTLSLELRATLAGHLDGALFYDTGNVALEHEDYLEFDGFRTAVGVGLRYLLPIGPLRIDLGVNPSPRDGEDDMVLHFAVGYPF